MLFLLPPGSGPCSTSTLQLAHCNSTLPKLFPSSSPQAPAPTPRCGGTPLAASWCWRASETCRETWPSMTRRPTASASPWGRPGASGASGAGFHGLCSCTYSCGMVRQKRPQLAAVLLLQPSLMSHFLHSTTHLLFSQHLTCRAENAVTAEWSPCGRYLMTATVAPRLRVDNGFQVTGSGQPGSCFSCLGAQLALECPIYWAWLLACTTAGQLIDSAHLLQTEPPTLDRCSSMTARSLHGRSATCSTKPPGRQRQRAHTKTGRSRRAPQAPQRPTATAARRRRCRSRRHVRQATCHPTCAASLAQRRRRRPPLAWLGITMTRAARSPRERWRHGQRRSATCPPVRRRPPANRPARTPSGERRRRRRRKAARHDWNVCLLVFACHLTFMLTLHLFGKLCDTSLSGIKLNAAGADAGCATLGGSVIPCLLRVATSRLDSAVLWNKCTMSGG